MAINQAPPILILAMSYYPFVGGAEIAVKEITDRIDDFEFEMVTARLDKKLPKFEKIGKVKVYRVGRGWLLDKYLFPFFAYFKAKKLHQEKNYQLVWTIMAFYAGLTALFFKWRYPQVKYLLTMQSGDSDLFIWLRTWFWYPLYKKIYTKPDYIQTISQFLAQRARRYGYQGKVEVVPNGVDIKKFSIFNFQFSIKDLKRELKITEDERVVITVSRLAKKNRLDDLIKAVAQLKVKLLILGSGLEEGRLKKLAKDLKIEDKILFLGHIHHDDLPKYLAIADIFVRPSLSEGLGSAFLEAMAMGLPVIGTPVGGIPDFLTDGKTGLFCQVKNPPSIAEKIKEILENNSLRERLIANGQRLVQEEYDWDKISQKINQIFHKLI